MSLIEPAGSQAAAQADTARLAHASLGGSDRATRHAPADSSHAAPPVDTAAAVTPPRAANAAAPSPEQPPPIPGAGSLTAALLHELRLQQELAAVQKQIGQSAR